MVFNLCVDSSEEVEISPVVTIPEEVKTNIFHACIYTALYMKGCSLINWISDFWVLTMSIDSPMFEDTLVRCFLAYQGHVCVSQSL